LPENRLGRVPNRLGRIGTGLGRVLDLVWTWFFNPQKSQLLPLPPLTLFKIIFISRPVSPDLIPSHTPWPNKATKPAPQTTNYERPTLPANQTHARTLPAPN